MRHTHTHTHTAFDDEKFTVDSSLRTEGCNSSESRDSKRLFATGNADDPTIQAPKKQTELAWLLEHIK